ncbi:MAG TPA: DsrE family protein [Methanomassiliicoccales archaeon]|nr:DsrE family protein [Methanomassiliicoccales archaeon]
MPNLVLDIAHGPFGHENAYAGLFAGMAWVSVGNDVLVILRGDGVFAARKGQADSMKEINLPNTEKQVRDILGEGGRIVADSESLKARSLSASQLVEGVDVAPPSEIRVLMVEKGERLISL